MRLERSKGLRWRSFHGRVALLLATAVAAQAAGPRWVTGPPYFNTAGQNVVWFTTDLTYYTDPGDLGPGVDHAAADALVAAAANVWNIPTASLVLSQGGELAEDVSGQNVFASSSGLIYPSDVQAQNGAAKPIAVVYDVDGSVTDLMLGAGASDPSGCRQNAVTESVDSITPDGLIRHAVLVLNGRCIGPTTEQQLQMQYQLMRAFGRVLGLGWSQTNDNVFTYDPAPTYDQAMHWPVMHPIDIVCGPYTYQCMPQPFTLRPDDVASLGQLYFIAQGTAPAGKTDTDYYANALEGRLYFPNGQGMQGVNIEARRWEQYYGTPEDWYEVSGVSGYRFRRANGNAVTGSDGSMAGSMGSVNLGDEGLYLLQRIPIISGDWQNAWIDTEPVNPLYTGPYSVGPYTTNAVEPSGGNAHTLAYVMGSYFFTEFDLGTVGAASQCVTGADGSELSPATVPATGWWSDTMCGYGHGAWTTLDVAAGRSFTVEVGAKDEAGNSTDAKMLPVIGLWNSGDAPGTPPTVAEQGTAFNGSGLGMTTLSASSTQAAQLRLAIEDERGDGRPDYNYQARILYADSVSPASLSAGGGTVTITGIGFRTGNEVLVNGVQATVESWSPNQIVVVMPPSSVLGTQAATVADVTVEDITTGGATTMTGVLSYAAAPAETMQLVSAPAGGVTVGTMAQPAFAVKVLAADGVTPVGGETVTFTANGGGVMWGGCSLASCSVITNAEGVAAIQLTPSAAGVVTLRATASSGAVTASFTATAPPPDGMIVVNAPAGVVYVGDVAAVAFTVKLVQPDGVTPSTGVPMAFTVSGTGGAVFGACGATSCTLTTDAQGLATTQVTATAAGAVVLSAAAGGALHSVGFNAVTRVRTLTMVQPVEYVAGGAIVNWQPIVAAADNSGAVTGVPVNWTVSSGAIAVSTADVQVSTMGTAQTTVLAGPIPAGVSAVGQACAWGTVCASFAVTAVEDAALRINVMSGGGQVVTGGAAAAAPLALRVTDDAGHPVAGATVEVYQTVSAAQMGCSGKGRCPVDPVYESTQVEEFSDENGYLTVQPLNMPGLAETTSVAVVVGTIGFAATTLQFE